MTEKKKRDRVVAEITLAHLVHLAREAGHAISDEQALTFLNCDGRAYAMWKEMMQAGEEYIKSKLKSEDRHFRPEHANTQRTRMVM